MPSDVRVNFRLHESFAFTDLRSHSRPIAFADEQDMANVHVCEDIYLDVAQGGKQMNLRQIANVRRAATEEI